nr:MULTISPECIES: Lsr2 family protein [Pseudonocardia]
MAQIQTVRLTDDLTGGKADETIPFTFDGKQLEIDLSTGNATALRKALAPFVAAARSVSPASGPRTGRAARRSTDSGPSGTAARQHNQAVRAWARQNGYTVSERGRIPAEVISAYQSATNSCPPQPGAAVQFSG